MASTLSWLAFSEKERRKALDVIDLFGDRDTRDELGIGTIRDAFADLFFPGISTIQTRARYFLFVPWIYTELERKRKDSREVPELARHAEVRLIHVLAEAEGEREGVIGFSARDSLKRLPSNIYWQGLGLWRIRLFPGSQDAYHRSLDRYYATVSRTTLSLEERLAEHPGRNSNWHPALPPAPPTFPRDSRFALSASEAHYLRERVLTAVPDSLLAHLLRESEAWDPTLYEYPWLHPSMKRVQPAQQAALRHAEHFALGMYGAALLYNLILAELADKDELRIAYADALERWVGEIDASSGSLGAWDRPTFWRLVRRMNPRIGLATERFVEHWLGLALGGSSAGAVSKSEAARALIIQREVAIKRDQARVRNRRALELWGGNAGAYRLNYRWGKAQRIALDIVQGLQGH